MMSFGTLQRTGALVALMVSRTHAHPDRFTAKYGACYPSSSTQGTWTSGTKIMNSAVNFVSNCNDYCCITDLPTGGYTPGTQYTLQTHAPDPPANLFGASGGSVSGSLQCNVEGNHVGRRNIGSFVIWTAPSVGFGEVTLGISCAGGYGPVMTFETKLAEAADQCADVVCPSDDCGTPGTCNPATGACSAKTPKANGTACTDDNDATTHDICKSGACTHTAKCAGVVCPGSDDCNNAASCSPATGACAASMQKPDGTACTDDNDATTHDVCKSGTCTHTTASTASATTPTSTSTAAPATAARQITIIQSGGEFQWQMASTTDGVVAGNGNFPQINLVQGDVVTFTGQAGLSHWFALAAGTTHGGINNANAIYDQEITNKGTEYTTEYTFDFTGNYVYYCPPHSTMVGRIAVGGTTLVSTAGPTTTESAPATRLSAVKYTVVGAGPGGVLAAHILSQATDGETRLLERGGMPNPGTYTYPFAANYNVQPTFVAATYNGDQIPLTEVFGGQQATNGGVYSPGTAKDLGVSLGVTEAAAAAAQSCASRSIDWTPEPARATLAAGVVPNIKQQTLGSDHSDRYGYLAECSAASGAAGCAWGDMLFASSQIKRRTVAQKLHGADTPPAYSILNTEVKRLVFTGHNGTELVATAIELVSRFHG